jgi:hypothetical protein
VVNGFVYFSIFHTYFTLSQTCTNNNYIFSHKNKKFSSFQTFSFFLYKCFYLCTFTYFIRTINANIISLSQLLLSSLPLSSPLTSFFLFLFYLSSLILLSPPLSTCYILFLLFSFFLLFLSPSFSSSLSLPRFSFHSCFTSTEQLDGLLRYVQSFSLLSFPSL